MDLFNRKKTKTLAETIATIDTAKAQVEKSFLEYQRNTEARIEEMATRIFNSPEDSYDNEYSGNRYKLYQDQVFALGLKYIAGSRWGSLLTGNIIDVRAAFIVGSGLRLKARDKSPDAKKALAFAKMILDENDFPREMLQELSKEAELEGKLLLKLFYVEGEIVGQDGEKYPGTIAIRHIPWCSTKYVIKTKEQDYMYYISATWQPRDKNEEEVLDEADFVYKRFSGRVSVPNDTPPKTAKCLTLIENLDMALQDWREINRIHASPTPHIETTSAQEARDMSAIISNQNWKIKRFLCHVGKFGYTSPDMSGTQSIEREIITLAKMISGTTGVPVHFLGLPDLMSNRSTADNLFELVYASTQKEREVWKGLLEEMINKSIKKYNSKTKLTPIAEDLVEIDIPFISQQQWDRLEKVWLPLYREGTIPLSLLLAKIPDIDTDAIQEEMDKEKADEFDRIKTELADAQKKTDAQDELISGQTPAGQYQNAPLPPQSGQFKKQVPSQFKKEVFPNGQK